MGYDFSKLHDREFEDLGGDIISKHLELRVEKFKAGKDGGVDGRFWIGDDKEGIIQCKHYLKSGYRKLISKLKNEELEKVKDLKPSRYIFITSVELSRENKIEIKNIFSPYIKRDGDVWGQNDLNDFLLQNNEIVERHYKLWITSAKVLDIIYNNAIKGRSGSTLKEIGENVYKYVRTENHDKGIEILNERNVIIITGEPGIGKTMLADNLALFYVANGYEFCDIEESISEAESLYREYEKKKIVFYFDDFLGSALFEAISNKKDSHIMKFINRVSRDKSKKFILTSRTNIFNIGESYSPIFKSKNIRKNEFLLKIDNLSEYEKAKILYNHIFFTSLNNDYIDQIYKDKRYRDIIRHQYFNPRIIEFITDKERINDKTPLDYWIYVKKNLDDPSQIWADYFQVQADDFVRGLVFLIVFNNGRINENDLKRSYQKFVEIRKIQGSNNCDRSFSSIIKIAIKSLVNRTRIEEYKFEYTLFNPSIADFVLYNYIDEQQLIVDVLISLKSVTSLEYLKVMATNERLDRRRIVKIQTTLFDYLFDEMLVENNWDYLIQLSYLDKDNPKIKDRVGAFIKLIANANFDNGIGCKLSELLSLIECSQETIDLENSEFLIGFIKNRSLDEEELCAIMKFIEIYKVCAIQLLETVREELDYHVQDMLDYFDDEVDLSPYIEDVHYDDGQSNIYVDESGIKIELENYVDGILSPYNLKTLDTLNFNRDLLTNGVSIDKLVDNYFDKLYSDGPDDCLRNEEVNNELDDIDTLFERS